MKLRLRQVDSTGGHDTWNRPGTWIQLNLQAFLKGCLSTTNPELLFSRESLGFLGTISGWGPSWEPCS